MKKQRDRGDFSPMEMMRCGKICCWRGQGMAAVFNLRVRGFVAIRTERESGGK